MIYVMWDNCSHHLDEEQMMTRHPHLSQLIAAVALFLMALPDAVSNLIRVMQ